MATSTRVLTLAYVTGAQEKAQGSRAGPRDRRRSQKVGFETDYNQTSLFDLQGDSSGHELGLVDLNFECSTVCPLLPWLMGTWQKRLGRWARRQNTQIKVNPTQVHDQMNHPVESRNSKM